MTREEVDKVLTGLGIGAAHLGLNGEELSVLFDPIDEILRHTVNNPHPVPGIETAENSRVLADVFNRERKAWTGAS